MISRSCQMFILLVITFYFSSWNQVHADYVLPYPGYMPGNKLYKISRIVDQMNYWWHWGNIGRTKYYLKLSDKYIVEAKTLFEYKQYLLAVDALDRSNTAMLKTPVYLSRAKAEGKDISTLESSVRDATIEHQRILDHLLATLPEKFTWIPEKSDSIELLLADRIEAAIMIRKDLAQDLSFGQ